MKLLILGGTQFVGRHFVIEALRRGHSLSLFNRGSHNALMQKFYSYEALLGDRNNNVTALENRSWDAVIDTSGYFPHQLRRALDVLADHIGHYTFISSISVYKHQDIPFQDEDAPLISLDHEPKEMTAETYGGLKVMCEQVAEKTVPDKLLNIRPGIIVGPYDTTDRFSYWPYRLAKGGEVLAPPEDAPMQYVDVRDLVTWVLDSVEEGQTGTYNAVNGADQETFASMLAACKEHSEKKVNLSYADEAFLLKNKVAPFRDLPLWIAGEERNFMRVSNAKATKAGLKTRPLTDTVQSTLEWIKTWPADYLPKVGLSSDREAELLKAWKNG